MHGSRSDHASDHRFPKFRFKISFYLIHVRLLVDIQFRSATVHSSLTQPEPASLGSVLPRGSSNQARHRLPRADAQG